MLKSKQSPVNRKKHPRSGSKAQRVSNFSPSYAFVNYLPHVCEISKIWEELEIK